jgi:uncharacterized protein YecE (DUF72 family)
MILVGTAGFKYEDWRGAFYPPTLRDSDMLAFYAQEFPVLEIDYTYYKMPFARTLDAMARKTPASFEFCVKAHKTMTHEVPPDEGSQQLVFAQFMEAVKPLEEQGKLGCVLLQFPWGFKPARESMRYIERLHELCGERPAVVEFRNSAWVKEETFGLLKKTGLGYCCVDEPKLHGLMPPVAIATSKIGYVRFHGRNAAKWWAHGTASERYDYLYSNDDLQEWLPRIVSLQDQTDKVFVLFNNCHEGKAAINARDMTSLVEAIR